MPLLYIVSLFNLLLGIILTEAGTIAIFSEAIEMSVIHVATPLVLIVQVSLVPFIKAPDLTTKVLHQIIRTPVKYVVPPATKQLIALTG